MIYLLTVLSVLGTFATLGATITGNTKSGGDTFAAWAVGIVYLGITIACLYYAVT